MILTPPENVYQVKNKEILIDKTDEKGNKKEIVLNLSKVNLKSLKSQWYQPGT